MATAPHATAVCLVWLTEFACSISLILSNKAILENSSLRFPVTLTAAHFVWTAFCTQCVTRHQQQHKPAADKDLTFCTKCSFAVISAVAIILSNASLCVNSVAVYQICKLCTLPFVAALEHVSSVRTYSWKHCAPLLLIMGGVGVAIEGSVVTSALGLFVALASVVATGLHQFLCGRLQSWFAVAPAQLLSYISPIKACLLIMLGPLLDNLWFGSDVTDVRWTPRLAAVLVVSCTLAAVLNWTSYTVISMLGVGRYQALSQLKTAAIIVVGAAIFDSGPRATQCVGTAVAIAGVYVFFTARKNGAGQERPAISKESDGAKPKLWIV